MIFTINWGNLQSILKRFTTEEKLQSPAFYYEDLNEVRIYVAKDNYVLYSSVPKSSIKDLVSFKMEFLSNAVELLEKPDSSVRLAIQQV